MVLQDSSGDGFNSTTVHQPFIPESQKRWTRVKKLEVKPLPGLVQIHYHHQNHHPNTSHLMRVCMYPL